PPMVWVAPPPPAPPPVEAVPSPPAIPPPLPPWPTAGELYTSVPSPPPPPPTIRRSARPQLPVCAHAPLRRTSEAPPPPAPDPPAVAVAAAVEAAARRGGGDQREAAIDVAAAPARHHLVDLARADRQGGQRLSAEPRSNPVDGTAGGPEHIEGRGGHAHRNRPRLGVPGERTGDGRRGPRDHRRRASRHCCPGAGRDAQGDRRDEETERTDDRPDPDTRRARPIIVTPQVVGGRCPRGAGLTGSSHGPQPAEPSKLADE
ncbi:MAG: hypothetical protein QOE27_2329, partial [Solirubrobacteraceae bacterium]|nr:hypothetical protein [Solirubrobacteraceae bacterium]